jgi:hypothetical protein
MNSEYAWALENLPPIKMAVVQGLYLSERYFIF